MALGQLRARRAVLITLAALVVAGTVAYALAGRDNGRPLSSLAPGQRHNYFTKAPAAEPRAGQRIRARVKTAKGDLEFRLHADQAPVAVNNFVFLARQGFYDGLTFHRVVKDFVAQAGDPLGTGVGGPGYLIQGEISTARSFDRPGVLALAGPGGRGGSQFFITMKPLSRLDGQYAVFGELISGADVLARLTVREPGGRSAQPAGDRIERIEILEN